MTPPASALPSAASSISAPALRVGGMAFGNGVLMRAGTHWALARDDGAVLDGAVPARLSRSRWLRLPVLRSLATFLEMLALSVRLHRHNGGRRAGRLVVWLAVMVAVSLGLGAAIHVLVHQELLADAALQALGLPFALLVLQVGMGGEVWRYHGAEHKAVHAYEARADLRDTAAVAAFSRVHDRCGTNLVLVVIVLALVCLPLLGPGLLGQVLALTTALLGLAAALELFRLFERHPRWMLARGTLACGRTLQRLLTTRDPRPEHLALACAALLRVLELESPAAR